MERERDSDGGINDKGAELSKLADTICIQYYSRQDG